MIDTTTLWVNGQEVSNAHRVVAYLAWAKRLGLWGECEAYCTFNDRCWQDYGAFADPLSDPAPWYNPADPGSGEFLGFVIDTIDGLDAPTSERTLGSLLTRGGVAGRRMDGPRTVKVTGTLLAITGRGMEFAQRWLQATLDVCDECAGANGTLIYRAACAPDFSASDMRRVLPKVSLMKINAPTPIFDDGPECNQFMQTTSFQMGVGSPDQFSLAVLPALGTTPIFSGVPQSCSATTSCCDPLRDLRRYPWQVASTANAPLGADPVPSITVVAGSTPLWFRIEVHHLNGDGTGSCVPQTPMAAGFACADPLALCDVQFLPAGSTLVLSGGDGRAYHYPAGGGGPLPGEQYIATGQTSGVRAFLSTICEDVCILGASTDLQTQSAGATWAVDVQYRYRQA